MFFHLVDKCPKQQKNENNRTQDVLVLMVLEQTYDERRTFEAQNSTRQFKKQEKRGHKTSLAGLADVTVTSDITTFNKNKTHRGNTTTKTTTKTNKK